MAVTLILSGFQACNKLPETSDGIDELLLFIPKPEVDYGSGNQFIWVTASSSWSITLEFEDGVSAWASIDQTSGTGSATGITISWEANNGTEARRCTFTLTSGTTVSSSVLLQSAKGTVPEAPTTLEPDPVAKWLELPATNDPNLYFFTHSMTQGQYKGRNYSFYLDPVARVSRWVAYPLNKGLIGSGSRTNAWGLDPKVPEFYQPVIFSGFRGSEQGVFYERGHQLPSADRYGSGVNETTFYGTNMTPQLGSLNEEAWAALEGYVRNWSYQFDTLYVVTGADLTGSTKYAEDNYGKSIRVPSGYYKALLGYKKNGVVGTSGSTGGYTAVGFYFEHKAYTNSASIVMAQAMTIDELETRTGVDFFVNPPARIGDDLAAKVESTSDSWWTKLGK